MRHISFGRHRGADWLSRSAFPLDSKRPAYERFVLRLHDPAHPRALWVSLSLVRHAGRTEARCSAVFFDGSQGRIELAEETWPLQRAAIDPERGGLGVGECQLALGHSHGLVRASTFALAWEVALAQAAPAQTLLPRAWLYRHHRLQHRASVPVPHATVLQGRVELWHALGRAAPRTCLDAAGWRASVHHDWGEGEQQVHALAHAHALEGAPEGAFLAAVAQRTKLFGRFLLEPQLGVLQLGPEPVPFCHWRALRGPGPAQLQAHAWRMELMGAGTAFVGEIRAEPHLIARTRAPFGGTLNVCELATLEATFTPRAAAARLVHAGQASLEVLIP